MSTTKKTPLRIGKDYTRQQIRVFLCQLHKPSEVLQAFENLEYLDAIELINKHPLKSNLDTFKINGKIS